MITIDEKWYKSERSERAEEFQPYTIDLKLPTVKPIRWEYGLAIVGGLLVVGISMGAAIATQMIIGTTMLLSLAALVESNKYLKYVVIKGNKTIDILLFVGGVIAVASLGPTIAGALTVMGLEYTLVYAPFIRKQNNKNN